MSTTSEKKKFELTQLRHLGALGVLGFFISPAFKYFFLLYLLGFLDWIKKSKQDEEELKQTGKDLKKYYRSLIFSQLNPSTIVLSGMQLMGHLYIALKHPKGLPSPLNYTNKVKYRLPFNGEWIAVNGGSTPENSHSWDILTQRYAYDFVITDSNGHSYRNDGTQLSDYYCYAKEILSPADGTVVKVQDKIRDYKGVGDYSIDWKVSDFRGNFVVIKHADREFSFLAHLQKGSVRVQKGDVVRAGDCIGLCGNSGHSTEPHLHFHLQDSADFWSGTGLPVRFARFTSRTETGEAFSKENAFVEKNEIVADKT